MNESYLVKEIQKYKDIIEQTKSEKIKIEREIEETKRKMQEFRLNYRQHVCQQILAQRATVDAAGKMKTVVSDNQSLPNNTEYMKLKTDGSVGHVGIGAGQAELPRVPKLKDIFQEAYEHDLALYNQYVSDREQIERMSNDTLPTDHSQVVSQVRGAVQPMNDEGQPKTQESQSLSDEPLQNETGRVDLVTFESETSVLAEYPQDVTYDNHIPKQPTKVTLNYSNTFHEDKYRTEAVPLMTSKAYEEEDLIIPTDSGCSRPNPFDPSASRNTAQEASQTLPDYSCYEPTNRPIDHIANYLANNQNSTNPVQKQTSTNLQKQLPPPRPSAPFQVVFEEPLSISNSTSNSKKFGNNPIRELVQRSSSRLSTHSKQSANSKVPSVQISYDNFAMAQSISSIAESIKPKISVKSAKPANDFLEKNKEIMNKFDDFFKKSKTKKENQGLPDSANAHPFPAQQNPTRLPEPYESEMALSQNTKHMEDIFSEQSSQPSSKKLCAYRYKQT